MNIYIYLESQLDILTLPLLIMALASMLIILESTVRLTHISLTNTLVKDAHRQMTKHAAQPVEVRDTVVERFLQQQLNRLSTGPYLLQMLAALAPVTGLLGTIIGLISSFDAVANSTTGVNPALVADGLGIAMKTSAAGLLIALPCLLFSNLFLLWAEKITNRAVNAINALSLQQSSAKSTLNDDSMCETSNSPIKTPGYANALSEAK
ncbi:hypothetical protein A3742_08150 [Oleiphilus sp. HI0071]|uniref:MotA/TolQ/ExbB proton channel family protein n=1 Tax=unclassified Oleiphilus TaxID=2631174 RepID=UPI0007C2A41D|nr:MULTISPECIES: MotA/TolQ/ExbB proton channel family protein [unclassified Oleiphilus]KZY72577.1 hypothetical protein A3737_10745 [Oleiphilus sp. HI0065]KZY82843.1 hypothetical protein A3742_08150 [Oleiphilus sp. HI0071]KZZ04844.1 hypothetical protein A3744_09220 [Oleiphilus sp. HI0073]KZZ49149.1 hypothetical protein A3760_02855 [Oleiphilus sp. HI0122]KZZ81266.1 hypothetical protein A3767_08305 [Oleiphilus sp. HI0133]